MILFISYLPDGIALGERNSQREWKEKRDRPGPPGGDPILVGARVGVAGVPTLERAKKDFPLREGGKWMRARIDRVFPLLSRCVVVADGRILLSPGRIILSETFSSPK